MNHREEAESLLSFLAGARKGDSVWHQVIATRALAHATLAGPEQLVGPGVIALPASGENMIRWMTADGREHASE